MTAACNKTNMPQVTKLQTNKSQEILKKERKKEENLTCHSCPEIL